MTYEQDCVRTFHMKYDHPVRLAPYVPPDLTELLLRLRLIVEETAEFAAAASNGELVEMADALADLLYVTYGTAVTLGINLQPIFQIVHAANVTKSGGKQGSGKQMKGTDFKSPTAAIIAELHRQGWKPEPSGESSP